MLPKNIERWAQEQVKIQEAIRRGSPLDFCMGICKTTPLDKAGKPRWDLSILSPNNLTNVGMNLRANLSNNKSGTVAGYIGLGSNATAPLETDTALGTELVGNSYARVATSNSIINAFTVYSGTLAGTQPSDLTKWKDTNRQEANHYWQYGWVRFKDNTTTAALQGIVRRISDFDGAGNFTQMSALPAQPVIGDTYDLHLPAMILYQAQFTNTSVTTWTVNEAGLFDAATGGNMIARWAESASIPQNAVYLFQYYSMFPGDFLGNYTTL